MDWPPFKPQPVTTVSHEGIERAIAQSRTAEEAARAVREAQPEIDAAVARATREAHEAMEKAKPEIAQAMMDAKIGEHAAKAAREAEPAIDAAMDEAVAKYDSRTVQMQVHRALDQAREEIAKAHDATAGQVALAPLPAGLAQAPCLDDDEVHYLCLKAAELEAAEGVPQDVEWAIARDAPFPDSVYILQHRPETTWPEKAENTEKPAQPEQVFDPVQYALRNVFKVPGR